MPVGRALDPEPVDVAVLVDVGQPRHFGIFDVAVVDQRVTFRLAKAAPERRQLAGSQILVAKNQDGMARERALDPGQGVGIHWSRQIDAERLSSERARDRTKRHSADHRSLLLLARWLILKSWALARQRLSASAFWRSSSPRGRRPSWRRRPRPRPSARRR